MPLRLSKLVFTILKVIIYIFGLDLLSETNASDWLMAVAAFTILFSSVVALFKDNLKALAYSTISQLSYIVLGAAMANPAAALGAAMHIVMHAVGKITLFFCAGAIFVGAHKKYISQMDGLAHKMPWTMAAFTVASFSIIGVPPLGGNVVQVVLGARRTRSRSTHLHGGPDDLIAAVNWVLNACGGQSLFPEALRQGCTSAQAPLLCVIPLCITAVGCVLLFLFPTPLRDLLLPILGEVT